MNAPADLQDPERIRSIMIVGGGTAGWMTAVYLQRFVHYLDCEITLVESAGIETVGVGEATIPQLVSFIRNLRLDENEFMRRCNATYKLGIKFIDWAEKGRGYWHPFGVCGGSIDGVDLFHFWVKSLRTGEQADAFSDYSMQALLGEAFKGPRSMSSDPEASVANTYAYHVDSAAFAVYLGEIARAEGVQHVFDEVDNVVIAENGDIERLETAGGRTLSADLYIDCTGFRGRLIEGALADPWVDWSSTLLCDRAVVTPLPRDPAMHGYTRSTAMNAGWRWDISLSHRSGSGYVYSSAHVDDESAAAELIDCQPADRVLGAAPRYLRMRVGHRESFWKGNCVSVGLAAGFIEPLESTGIYFIQIALELLMDYFPSRRLEPPLRAAYNRTMTTVYEQTRDFVLLHYVLSKRSDTRFWRDSSAVELPGSLAELIALYDEIGLVRPDLSPFPETSYHFIFAGNGRLPRRTNPHSDRVDYRQAREIMDQIKIHNVNVADPLPTHRALMQSIHARDEHGFAR